MVYATLPVIHREALQGIISYGQTVFHKLQTVAQKSHDLEVFGHGFTYSGHPVSAAVALETLKIYEEMDILGHVMKIAPLLKKGIDSFGHHPIVGEVSAVGLLAVAELVSNKTSLKPFSPREKSRGPPHSKSARTRTYSP
jgi:adenosylmethionine-8-amino-7-oxononanoate aminotransferase